MERNSNNTGTQGEGILTPMQRLIKRHRGPAAFSRLTRIPHRTVTSWHRQGHADGRTPPGWLARHLAQSIQYEASQA